MKVLLKCFYFFLIAMVAASPVAANVLQSEILGVKWGTDISALKNYVKLWQKDSVSFYLKPGVNHTIYEIQIPGVVYGFYSDKFFAAYAKIDDPTVFSRLKSELTAQYGNPKITLTMKNEQRIFTWKDGNIRIKLKHYQQGGKMKLAFYYMPLSETVNETQQEELQEKTWTLFPIETGKTPKNLKPEDLPSIPILRF
ncbi:MAG: hypothetical protein P1P89_03585 [Desulfobacterales bacterium]|nr:hypothetical protein [Desulfobacterales bacterium]